MKHWWSFSTAIILVIVGIIVSTFLLLIPWSLVFSNIPISSYQKFTVIFGVGSPIWVFLISWVLDKKSQRKHDNYIKTTRHLNIDRIEYFQIFSNKLKNIQSSALKNIEYRIDGSHNFEDKGGSVRSPEIVATSSSHTIILPASFIARFKKHPSALAAVLLHEIGHVVNKDLLFLFKLRTFLYALIFVAVSYVITLHTTHISPPSSLEICIP